MADQSKVAFPNGTTGQEFQVDIKSIIVNVQAQTSERLVTDPGKKTEKAIELNPYGQTAFQIHIPLSSPEEVAQADQDVMALLLPKISDELAKRYK